MLQICNGCKSEALFLAGEGCFIQVGMQIDAVSKLEGIWSLFCVRWQIVVPSAEVDQAYLWIDLLAGNAPWIAYFGGGIIAPCALISVSSPNVGTAIGFTRLTCGGINEANDMSLMIMNTINYC